MENKIRNFTSITKEYIFNRFTHYSIIENGKTSTVPLDPANTDYQAIQKWIAEGGEVINNPPQENN